MQLLAPAEGTVAYFTEFCRDDNFLQHNTGKEGFFSDLYEARWKPYALQRYTVKCRAVISVLMRLTSTRLLQFSQALGPCCNVSKHSCSMPVHRMRLQAVLVVSSYDPC